MINIQLRILESPDIGLSSIHPHLTIGYIIFYTVVRLLPDIDLTVLLVSPSDLA